MECELLPICGFFKKHGVSEKRLSQDMVKKFCKGDEHLSCKRFEYRLRYGAPPSDDMLPSGLIYEPEIIPDSIR
jgi:hypothetical protein